MDYHGAKNYIINKLEKELPDNLYYHGAEHTIDVLQAVEMYADLENVAGDDLILLQTAALFHDSGFLTSYCDSEAASIRIVNNVLPDFNYSPSQIDNIGRMILSTKIPQEPQNILEQILCDADLDYLGRDDFYMTGIKLLCEWNENGIATSLKQWYEVEINFLKKHRYFTQSAIKLRLGKKKFYLDQIVELLGGAGQTH